LPVSRETGAFEKPLALTHEATPLCPFIAAAVEIADPEHPALVRAREYKKSVAARLTETAREAGAADPDCSGSSWRCCSTAPRPGPGPLALTPSRPPPTSRPR
jgi:hypothetical protein